MIVTGIPIDIPDGRVCKDSSGEVCRLFHWGFEGPSFCRGWGGLFFLADFQKHPACMSLVAEKNACENLIQKQIKGFSIQGG
ncbi:hypothetical protein A2996_03315 [Candidatus Campbellbacteria bacterium RIFCSPLOWO2_01_FULL_34_15]|uniref:Uncharacterized protein n=2 Tax=Candidatus Campbelliibacteriota TaxID=1752727 RepID=A0A1F5EPV0_9BACT|nr:MAG: hypothetical protein A2811_01135 [Candidatus Campbellbacteria bacterium RIFCSPHIGHO2_01_FULL_34_10]OGD69350.1 MAG: hypothetical protein A2996_03315 [Candidatus Campbellbacteria bacterium RIFCSPLOWO2_01_FULL_34_15]